MTQLHMQLEDEMPLNTIQKSMMLYFTLKGMLLTHLIRRYCMLRKLLKIKNDCLFVIQLL